MQVNWRHKWFRKSWAEFVVRVCSGKGFWTTVARHTKLPLADPMILDAPSFNRLPLSNTKKIMSRKLETIRNIGVIAHIDAGKTTVTERMLFYSGAKHRVGEVDKGTTTTDVDPEEQERGITIYSACVTFPWQDVIINLIDTPGHVDFTAEVERSLRVLDGGVVVFSAREGVEAQSETVWRQADKYGVPRLAFINKLDREGADFEGTLADIKTRLEANPVPLQIPVGQGPAHMNDPFRGVIDLIAMKMLEFPQEEKSRQIVQHDIPDEFREAAEVWRESMLESLYEHSDQLMELALQEEAIPDSLVRQVIRNATLAQQMQPVLCGSALHGIGVQPLLDGIAYYLPNPADMPPVEGVNPKNPGPTACRQATADEPLCGLVFKILPAKTGDFYWVRIYSGRLKANTRVYNPGQDKKENVSQLWHIHSSKKEEQVDAVECGDIVGVIGMRHSVTGDTICDSKEQILLESISFPETVISMAIEPETTTARKKLAEALELLKRQDPTFRAVENEETGQTLISGMGELHLEVIKHKLLRDFDLNVKVHKPRVNYRETVERSVEITGECNRQMAGQQHYARLNVLMEPEEKAGTVQVINRCPHETIPQPLLSAALEELEARGHSGGLIGGFPLTKLRVTVLGGEVQIPGSTEVAFRIAAGDAFESGLRKAGSVLLEPIMRLDITTPQEYLGDFVSDLQQRRSIIARTDNRSNLAVIEAHAPLAELVGYSSAMRSISQGRAVHSMEPLRFAPAPSDTSAEFS